MPALPTVTLTTSDGREFTFLVTQGPNEIPYLEELEYTASYAPDAVSMTRKLLCQWEDKEAFIDDLLGRVEYIQGHTVGGIETGVSRTKPEAHPFWEAAYAVRCELQGGYGVPTEDRENFIRALTSIAKHGELSQYEEDTLLVSFNLARFQVTYEPLVWDVLDDDEVEDNELGELNRSIKRYYVPSGENQPIPGGAFKFESDPGSAGIPEPGVITFPMVEVHYVWNDVPVIDLAGWLPIIGKCNEEEFDNYFPPESLVCLPFKTSEPRYSAAGDFVFTVEFIFGYRPQATWNQLYRRSVGNVTPPAPGFENIIGIDGTTLLYPTADFMRLFRIDVAEE